MQINLYLAIGLGLLVCCSWFCDATTNDLSSQPPQKPEPRLFRILNFNNFKTLFRKHYKSWTEELSRMRIFLAKCLRSFVSVVKYKQGQATAYKSINHMSDWTEEEFRKILIKGEVLRGSKKGRKAREPPAEQVEDESVESGADRIAADIHSEDDVRRKIIEEARKLDVAQADKSLSELKGAAVSQRRKRNVDAATLPKLDTADLMGGYMAQSDSIQHPEIEGGSERVIRLKTEGERRLLLRDGDSDGPGVVTRSMVRNKGADGLMVDHRGCLPTPIDQQTCGSCYIFASIAALEYQYCMSTGKMTKFAEQFALDCGEDGCDGGWPGTAVDFFVERGLERHEAWPYFNLRNECPLRDTSKSGYWHVSGLEKRTVELAKFEEEIVNGPIIAFMEYGPGFEEYGGGIDQADGCNETDDLHCMLVVGHGRENGHDFWLIRNSFGPDWGENGYYKISKQAFARCYINDLNHNGLVIDGEIRFRRNRNYDHDFIDELTKKWQRRLGGKQLGTTKKKKKRASRRNRA